MQKKVKRQMVFKSLCLGILYLGLSFPSVAETQEPVDMVAVERAIEASKGDQGKVSCGKIDMGNKRYTFRIPKIYQGMFGIEYHGDSIWQSGGVVKKENPCLYDIKIATLNFLWPSMKPSDGIVLGLEQTNNVNTHIRHISLTPVINSAFQVENLIRSLKRNVIGNPGETEIDSNIVEDAKVLAMGKYRPELGLYQYTFDRYIEPTPSMIKQGLIEKRHNKRDIFWSLDRDNRVIDLIVCNYLKVDPSQMTLIETDCDYTTRLYQYDASILVMRYGGSYLKDWKNIKTAAIKQFEVFITEEDLL